MRHGEIVELEIPSAPEYVSIVRQAVGGLARRMEFSLAEIEDIKLAVGEACTNAVKYACPGDDGSYVGVRCIIARDGLMVEIRNNISECESPIIPTEPDLSRVGGLGLYLIKQLVDEVDICWERETATVRMLKRFQETSAL